MSAATSPRRGSATAVQPYRRACRTNSTASPTFQQRNTDLTKAVRHGNGRQWLSSRSPRWERRRRARARADLAGAALRSKAGGERHARLRRARVRSGRSTPTRSNRTRVRRGAARRAAPRGVGGGDRARSPARVAAARRVRFRPRICGVASDGAAGTSGAPGRRRARTTRRGARSAPSSRETPGARRPDRPVTKTPARSPVSQRLGPATSTRRRRSRRSRRSIRRATPPPDCARADGTWARGRRAARPRRDLVGRRAHREAHRRAPRSVASTEGERRRRGGSTASATSSRSRTGAASAVVGAGRARPSRMIAIRASPSLGRRGRGLVARGGAGPPRRRRRAGASGGAGRHLAAGRWAGNAEVAVDARGNAVAVWQR